MNQDEKWMRRALALAERGRGRTSPNPIVGAVIVRKGRVLAEGWHKRAGGHHAEVEALKRVRNPRGAVLYVTLEPCSTHGRTPPCTEAIKDSGIRRIVVGCTDPNPKHSGRGIRLLRGAGVRVTTGVLGKEAIELNRSFNHWITTGRPWVTAKAAMTLDGKIATRTGDSKWITNSRSRRYAHQLRAQSDAILVGVNTVLRDNPRLTARGFTRTRPLLRVILDPSARTPPGARILRGRDPTLIVVSAHANKAKVQRLISKGAMVWKMPATKSGFDLKRVLDRLGRHEITSLLVEGGSATLGAFFDDHLVNRLCFFYAPKIVGGVDAVKAVGGRGVARMKKAPVFDDFELRRFGDDLLISAYV